MSAGGQVNWDSIAPRANAGSEAGAVNWDAIAPKANPGAQTGQHVQAHPLKGQNFGDWLSEELLQPVVDAATQLGRGVQGLGHPEQRPLTESVKDVVRGGSQIVAPFAAAGLNSEQAPAGPPTAGAPSAVGTALKGAATGAVKAIPKAAETSILRYTGVPQIARGAYEGAKAALKTRAEAAAQPAETPATPAAPTEDEQMLAAIQRGQQNAAAQAASSAPKAYQPRPPEYYGVKPAQTPPTTPANNPPVPSAAPEVSAAPPAPATVEPIRPEPQAPAPRPASKAQTANAQAKADRFVDAIRRFNSDNPQQALSADELAAAGDKEKGMLAQGLKQGGYLKNTEQFPDTSFPYMLQKLKDAETAARQTIKPPKGFSLGAFGTAR